jgi:hypothetical protein
VARKAAAITKLGVRLLASAAIVFFVSAFVRQSGPAPVFETVSEEGNRITFPRGKLPALDVTAGERREVMSLLKVPSPMTYGEFVWDEAGVPHGKIWVRVDLKAQIISVFRGGHEIGTATVLFGADEKPTPAGRFAILEKRKDHVSSLYGAPMPYTLRLTNDGIAIHGSDVRVGAATHGCVGIPLGFADKLFQQARVGDEVVVVEGGKPSLPRQDRIASPVSGI